MSFYPPSCAAVSRSIRSRLRRASRRTPIGTIAVVYNELGGAPWKSGTNNPTDRIVVQGDGNVVIYDAAHNVGWAAGTDH